jgi:hypothetical protein
MALLVSAPAYALFGVGDVTFDPTTYAEVVKNTQQLVDLYHSAMQQLDRLSKMQQAMAEAGEAYDTVSNLNLHQMAKSLNPKTYMQNTNGKNQLQQMRSAIYNAGSAAQQDVSFVKGQMQRIQDLETMMGLQDAASENLSKASTDLDIRRSGQITAQSTSALAALAAANEQRQQQAEMAKSMEHQNQQGLVDQNAALLQSMGGRQ